MRLTPALRLTPYALRALRVARREAAAGCGRETATAEHLLAALLENPDNLAVRTLEIAGIDVEALGRALALFVRRRPDAAPEACPAGEPVEVTEPVGRLVRLGRREAERLGDRRLGTEHLLLGIAAEGASAAARILLGVGGELPALRIAVASLRPAGGGVTALSHAAGDAPPVSRGRAA